MAERVRISIRGAVQGVGFRPFIYRLAVELGLPGWVSNSPQGVIIEAEGEKPVLDTFILRIGKEKPAHSFIQNMESTFLDMAGFQDFEIRESRESGAVSALVLPEIATCGACREEIFDPADRRYRYPFTNCTHCGPRYTIIENLPYDRAHTSMKIFPMCPECLSEYEDPGDRRFHAQPNACPACGPHLELWNSKGVLLASGYEALLETAEKIRQGGIAAVKGLGGFHLMVDARNGGAVVRLRRKKHREEKPLALMAPDLHTIREDCVVGSLEERLLLSSESPIVILNKRSPEKRSGGTGIAESVAPENPRLGVMLPYTPLHHLLMTELGIPVVATSGNLSDEPICFEEGEALNRLGGMADCFLVHNRPILRPVDDSVVGVVAGREMVIRRARGYAPLPVQVNKNLPPVVALGGHLKNTVAVTSGRNVFISQHIGDLGTAEACDSFKNVVSDLCRLFDISPRRVVCDRHPDYFSTQYAMTQPHPVQAVQHHHAHVASCMAENELDGPVLGVSWDGSGYGANGTVWGGEFLLAYPGSFKRFATFRPFRLPGNTSAVKEPRRSSAGILFEIFGSDIFHWKENHTIGSFSMEEGRIINQMLEGGINSPWTTSAGRLFDGIASLTGIRQRSGFEGQGAMELEYAIGETVSQDSYPPTIRGREELEAGGFLLGRDSPFRDTDFMYFFDWQPMILEILGDLKRGVGKPLISVKFHNTLVGVIVELARRSREKAVVLSGGCFQNRYLLEKTIMHLKNIGFRPYWHQRVPPNDGGLSLGQIYAATEKETFSERERWEEFKRHPLVPLDFSQTGGRLGKLPDSPGKKERLKKIYPASKASKRGRLHPALPVEGATPASKNRRADS